MQPISTIVLALAAIISSALLPTGMAAPAPYIGGLILGHEEAPASMQARQCLPVGSGGGMEDDEGEGYRERGLEAEDCMMVVSRQSLHGAANEGFDAESRQVSGLDVVVPMDERRSPAPVWAGTERTISGQMVWCMTVQSLADDLATSTAVYCSRHFDECRQVFSNLFSPFATIL
ncbi:hypothetical protein M406DRAFT_73912 [Cryphonectria parasitica EP155]|uniref:Uncharacterized protein n=1 Tax=Cryphonectria parasitica (strain ATCC 38755 / EP155) TaxID=660469 RepID=A0A9P5CLG0_CRYP1|nr:uncharacterized protein M406DRAFT_73912 [Cryphonectria parasitica EP155]KAF3763294.1 hypothetical protein M406DRAFT_73912 [Cryphonectria parasitica EP155]